MLTWRHVGILCALAAYLAWAANNLWHDWQERPGDVEPDAKPLLVEMV